MNANHLPPPESEPIGRMDGEGELYLPSKDEPGASPGGAMEEGTTSGTTGRILPPGAENQLDDKVFP